jgi:hypothetical protein
VRIFGTLLAAAAACLISGCAGSSEPAAPRLESAAVETRAANRAYLEGRVGEAIASLREAVRLHLASGDLPGAARAELNLALALRASGDRAAASAASARLRDLTPGAIQQLREREGNGKEAGETAAVELAAGSAWLDARLDLDRGDGVSATRSLSGAPGGLSATSPFPGRIENLRAEILLSAGSYAQALDRALAGEAASLRAQDRAEEAHGLGLAGDARIGLGRWLEARADYLAAVGIEEGLGGGARMAADLGRLAMISSHLGDPGEANLYELRAEAIASALTSPTAR